MRVYYRLTLERIRIVLDRNADVGKHLQVGLPADDGTGALFLGLCSAVAVFRTGTVFAFFKVQAVFIPVAADGDIHIFRGVLRCAGAQSVQTERKLIIFPVVVFIFAAGIHLAKNELPVIAALALIVFDRDAAAVVLDLYRAIQIAGNNDAVAKALARLVDGVGQDLKYRVLTAVQPVRAEDNARTLADTVRALQRGNALIAVLVRLFHSQTLP